MKLTISQADRDLVARSHDAAVLGIIKDDGAVSLRSADPVRYCGHVDWVRRDGLALPLRGFSLGVANGRVTSMHRESVLNGWIPDGTIEADLVLALLSKLPCADHVHVFPPLKEGADSADA